MCAGRRARSRWLRWKPHMLFGWTNKDHMTYTRKEKKNVSGAISRQSLSKRLFFLSRIWIISHVLSAVPTSLLRIKKKPPSCPVPVPVLFLPLNGSFSPKASHFSNSAQIVLVGLIKNHFLPYNSTLTIRVSVSQISILIRLWFRPAEWRLSSSTASVPAVAGLFPVQKSKRHIHRSAKIFSPTAFKSTSQ